MTGKLQVGKYLSEMNAVEAIDALQLQDNARFHQQVDPVDTPSWSPDTTPESGTAA